MKERGGAIEMKDSLSEPWCMKKQKDFAPNAMRLDHTFDHFIILRLLFLTVAVQLIPIPGRWERGRFWDEEAKTRD